MQSRQPLVPREFDADAQFDIARDFSGLWIVGRHELLHPVAELGEHRGRDRPGRGHRVQPLEQAQPAIDRRHHPATSLARGSVAASATSIWTDVAACNVRGGGGSSVAGAATSLARNAPVARGSAASNACTGRDTPSTRKT